MQKLSRESCSFTKCPNTRTNTYGNIIFHKFPVNNVARREEWSKACNMVDIITSQSLVCADHFEPQCYPNLKEHKLLSASVPSIPARRDHKQRFLDKKDGSFGNLVYPMLRDWGPALCRLCTQPVAIQKRESVIDGIHIFGQEGQSLQLQDKINMYLPNKVELEDSLPKFACRTCINHLIDAVDIFNKFNAANESLKSELEARGSFKNLEKLTRSRIVESPNVFKCKSCSHIFPDMTKLLSHELTHLKAPLTPQLSPTEDNIFISSLPHSCQECSAKFYSKHSLRLHSLHKHCKNKSESLVSVLLDHLADDEDAQFVFIDNSKQPNHVHLSSDMNLSSDSESIEQEGFGGQVLSNEALKTKVNCVMEPKDPVEDTHSSKMKRKLYQTRASKRRISDESPNEKTSKRSSNVIKKTIPKVTNDTDDEEFSTSLLPIKKPLKKSRTKKFVCSTCESVFTNVNRFKKHLQGHEVKEKLTCDHCNKRFTVSGLKLHLLRVSKEDREYICDTCKKVFKDRHYLVMHIRNTHNLQRLQCSKCPRSFKSKEGLQGHLMRHEGIYSFLCDICGKSFLTHSSMRIHRRRHTQQNFFTCNTCGKKIQEHNRFQDHLRTHTGETPFACNLCDRQFHSKKLVKQHMQIHNDLRPHKCNQCNLSFKRVGNLKQHMQRHRIYRPICSICRASFDTCEERNEHRRQHTQEERHEAKIARLKPKGPKRNRNQFLCKGCKTVFYSKEEKAEHIAQNPDHTKSIKCETCGQTFRSRQSLTIHKRVHTGERPYTCTVCLKGFRTYATCRQHTQIHSSECKYKCEMCDRTFNRLYTLTVHKRSHSNERPFSCPSCGRGFKQKQDMKKHMRLHMMKEINSGLQHGMEKWGQMTNEENLAVHHLIQGPPPPSHHHHHPHQSVLAIPADIHQDLQYNQSNLLATSDVVITVPFVHSGVSTDHQAFFSM